MGFSLILFSHIVIWSAAFTSWAGSFSLCASSCTCKWKSGKQTAECVGKGLAVIPSGLNPGTQVIDLSGNVFENISTRVFQDKDLVNLQKIYLSESSISVIEAEAFYQLSNLVELDLSGNELTEVPAEALKDCHHLRRLNLAQNPIKLITEDVFLPLASLVFLDLSKCGIETLPPGSLNGLNNLIGLKLDGNQLSELSLETFESLTQLSGLDLHNNPWNCDCRLRDVRKWMLDQNIPLAVPPDCVQPRHAKGTTWGTMTLDDFACTPKIITPSANEESFTVHQNASLLCQVESIPRASVYWEVGGRYLMNVTYNPEYRGKYVVEYDGTPNMPQSSRLTIMNVAESDGDVYTCIAENRAGNASVNFTIFIVSPYALDGSLGTTQIIIITVSVLLVVVIALVIISLLMFHPTAFLPGTKVNGVTVLKQLKAKNQDAVEMHATTSEKQEKEVKSGDRQPRHETGSSGYGSDQLTPDLVSKIGDTNHGPSLSTSTVSCGHGDFDNPIVSEAFGPPADHWSTVRAIPPRYDDSSARGVYSEIYPNPCYGTDDHDCFLSQSPTVLHHADFHGERYIPQNDRVRTLRAGYEYSGSSSAGDCARDDTLVSSSSSGSWKRSPLAVSANVNHYMLPTKARFSPDEGYAEEALEGTEV